MKTNLRALLTPGDGAVSDGDVSDGQRWLQTCIVHKVISFPNDVKKTETH